MLHKVGLGCRLFGEMRYQMLISRRLTADERAVAQAYMRMLEGRVCVVRPTVAHGGVASARWALRLRSPKLRSFTTIAIGANAIRAAELGG